MDNETMVETFKFFNYCQLATSSLVSQRFWNIIRSHRHKLALLDVSQIYMNSCISKKHLSVTKMFNEELSTEEYNEWIVRNGYTKQIPLDNDVAGKESTQINHDIYEFNADVYQNPNHYHDATIFIADVELKDETWPLFQHFIRLLMDPFIYIRSLSLGPQKDVVSLLTGTMNPDRLQCKELDIDSNGDTQKLIAWIKDHVRCDEFEIFGNNDSIYDEELLNLFLTGAPCTPAINVVDYDLSKIIINLVQKFMCLKNRGEYQVVESTRGTFVDQGIVEELKRNCTEFIAKEKPHEEGSCTRQIIEFINDDIEKKLTFDVTNFHYGRPSSFSTKITNL